MDIKRLLMLLVLAVWSINVMLAEGRMKMMVISDTHVMNPELLERDGKAFQDYVAHDRKMLKESPRLMEQATEKIIREKPEVLLITGDLTKDGETVSHRYLCDRFLSRIRQAGIRIFVVPGNHDVRNPHAVKFFGDTVSRVPSPDAAEFAAIYKDFGYGEALSRDTASLSYVVQLDKDTRLLCLDACEYENNDFTGNTCVTAGRLKPQTLAFIKAQAEDAHSHGMRLLAMMHHGVVQHWTWQEKVMGEYLVDHWRKVARLFSRLGIEIVFTGHFHAQDISQRGSLYDIETGSLVSYPSPMRTVVIDGRTVSVSTSYLDATGLNQPQRETLQQYGAGFAREGIQTIVGDMLPAKVTGKTREEVLNLIADAYVAHLAGDEKMPEEKREQIKRVAAALRHKSWKYAFIFSRIDKYLWTDLKPQDNNITITLKTLK